MVKDKAIREKLDFLKQYVYHELNLLKIKIQMDNKQAEKNLQMDGACFTQEEGGAYVRDAKLYRHKKAYRRCYRAAETRQYIHH